MHTALHGNWHCWYVIRSNGNQYFFDKTNFHFVLHSFYGMWKSVSALSLYNAYWITVILLQFNIYPILLPDRRCFFVSELLPSHHPFLTIDTHYGSLSACSLLSVSSQCPIPQGIERARSNNNYTPVVLL